MSLITELKRRNVFRVAVAYAVIAWLTLQISDVLVEALEIPTTLSKALIAIFVIGFIPVLAFSWVYEMTPDGLKKESEVQRDDSITAHTAKKLDTVVILLLVVAIGIFAVDRFMRPGESAPVQATQAVSESQVQQAAPVGEDEIPVVAVLPLQAMSQDEEGTFLASGLHDDLLTRLAKLQAFKVISRTSVMEYLGTTKNMRQIGQELGAGFIVEGGLQSIGGRVSINAQLIDASTDEHLWAETFNRELTTANLFEVQAEIAGAISEALHATLSPEEMQTLQSIPTESFEAYQAYLGGLENAAILSRPSLQLATNDFSTAVELDPAFSDAWARLSIAHIRQYWEEGGEDDATPDPILREMSLRALEQARVLAPDDPTVLLAEGYYYYYGFRDYEKALEANDRALELAPNNNYLLALRGFLLRRLGRMDEAANYLMMAMQYDPINRGYLRESVTMLRHANRCDEALQILRRGRNTYPDFNGLRNVGSSAMLFCENDFEAAREMILDSSYTTFNSFSGAMEKLTYLHDYEAAIETAKASAPKLPQDPVTQLTVTNYLAWFYRQTGQDEMAEQKLVEAVELGTLAAETSTGVLERARTAALLGDKESVRELTARARELRPKDDFMRPFFETDVLRSFAMVGDEAALFLQMDLVLGIARTEEKMRLAREPTLDPYRDDPRFPDL